MNTLNFVLETVTKDTRFDNIGDALGYALPKSVFGFLTVFSVLALIWGILALFKVFFYTIPAKTKLQTKNETAVKPAPAATAAVEPAANDESDIVAAITAAITRFRESTGAGTGSFRVVSFKKRK